MVFHDGERKNIQFYVKVLNYFNDYRMNLCIFLVKLLMLILNVIEYLS